LVSNRNAGHLAGLLVAALATSTGCADQGDESLMILGNTQPGNDCQLSNSATMFQTRGRIDTQAVTGYLFTPLVSNRATRTQSQMVSRVAFIEGANVDLSFPGGGDPGNSSLTSFAQPFSGSISPNGGQSTFAFEIIPKATLDAMGLASGEIVQVIADVQVYGTMDGNDIDSNTFHYPIDVCNGCLYQNLGDCTALPEGYMGTEGGKCQALQDGVLECCNSGGTEICPAAYIAPE
jgi:hypothetical protein